MYKNGERMMAWVAKIDKVVKHPEADSLDVCTVGGWSCVTKLGEFKTGDLAVYVSIDSWVPTELAAFLSKGKEPKEFNGVKGERLRTVKLRGALSQGLLLKGIICPTGLMVKQHDSVMQHIFQEGDDVTEWLGIQKWERPIPAQLAGQVRGNFPTAVPKTDQERAQNLVKEIAEAQAKGLVFEVTEKLEGSSCTFFLDREGDFHVCSRNLDLKRDENNSFWRAAIKYNIEAKMREFELNGYAIQGELIGPNIQGNIYGLSDIEFHVFDVYNSITGNYMIPAGRLKMIGEMGLNHVPVVAWEKDLSTGVVSDLLELADGPSKLGKNPMREGLVWKEMNGGMTFKTISNAYLLKGGE